MELSMMVLSQVAVMFLLIGLGFLAGKIKFVNEIGNTQITSILLYFVSPLVIINAYQMPFSADLLKNLLLAFLLGIISHIIAIAVAYIFIGKKWHQSSTDENIVNKNAVNKNVVNKNVSIERFSVIYSNCGFMALPLVSALFGEKGVFYASAYMVVFQLLSWTHGYILMSQKTDLKTIKSAFLSPVVLSVFVGLLLFFFNMQLPLVLSNAVSSMAALNTPLAMLVTGVTLSQTRLPEAFTTKRCYYISFLSLVLVPLIAMSLYLFLPIPTDIVVVNLISTACPCAVLTILFANKFSLDKNYASKILTLQNVAAIFTIPLIVLLYQTLSTI